MASDLDYLAALVHGRRSHVAEAERLDGLCRTQNLPDFARTMLPEREFRDATDLQRQLVEELVRELSGFPYHLAGAGARLFDWILTRFQVENLKVLIRACITRAPIEKLSGHLSFLPKELTLQAQALATAESPAAFAGLLPRGPLRKSVMEALKVHGESPRPFFFEAALDRGYFGELLARVERLSSEDQEAVKAMMRQEVDTFHLMLALRGRFHYALAPDLLLPFHVAGTAIPRVLFAALLNDPDFRIAVGRVVGHALDESPAGFGSNEASSSVDVAAVESLAWKRYLRLANRAFRQSHMGLGAVVGYVGIRRLEVANLITISEGIRMGLAADIIRARLIPRTDSGVAYV